MRILVHKILVQLQKYYREYLIFCISIYGINLFVKCSEGKKHEGYICTCIFTQQNPMNLQIIIMLLRLADPRFHYFGNYDSLLVHDYNWRIIWNALLLYCSPTCFLELNSNFTTALLAISTDVVRFCCAYKTIIAQTWEWASDFYRTCCLKDLSENYLKKKTLKQPEHHF